MQNDQSKNGQPVSVGSTGGSASDTDRLELLMQQFIGMKWNDCGPLVWWKPEDEKYVTRESLLARLDAELPLNTAVSQPGQPPANTNNPLANP